MNKIETTFTSFLLETAVETTKPINFNKWTWISNAILILKFGVSIKRRQTSDKPKASFNHLR